VSDEQSKHGERDDDRVSSTKCDVDNDEKQSLRVRCANGK